MSPTPCGHFILSPIVTGRFYRSELTVWGEVLQCIPTLVHLTSSTVHFNPTTPAATLHRPSASSRPIIEPTFDIATLLLVSAASDAKWSNSAESSYTDGGWLYASDFGFSFAPMRIDVLRNLDTNRLIL